MVTTENMPSTSSQALENNNDPTEDQNLAPLLLTIRLPNSKEIIQAWTHPTQPLYELRQRIIDNPKTCHITCFYLAFEGKRLSDWVELGSVEGLVDGSKLDILLDDYTEREVRIHFNRLRDWLNGPILEDRSCGISSGASYLASISSIIPKDEKDAIKQKDEKKLAQEREFIDTCIPLTHCDAFSKHIPEEQNSKVTLRCLKRMAVSGWNPPLPSRKLKGDLMYFVVETLENITYHITAHTNGFFVNLSTADLFNPNPMTKLKHHKAHCLVELLQHISPEFKLRFVDLHSSFYKNSHPYETVTPFATLLAYPWLVNSVDGEYDDTRPQEPLLLHGIDGGESLRDWNDEIQSHREVPYTSLNERILGDRTLVRTHAEFVEAATKGAMLIVNKNVPSFNPFEPFKNQMFVYNNIFFRFAFGGYGQTDNMGAEGDYAASGKMVEGVRLINAADIEGLHTLPTVVIDYQGYRVLAHTIVPGIFRQVNPCTVVYGTTDDGKVEKDENIHKATSKLAEKLHLAEHTILDKNGNPHTLNISADVKGVNGTDGRAYLLDTYRINAVDINFIEECKKEEKLPDYPHQIVMLRPELVELFFEHKIRQAIQDQLPKKEETKTSETQDNSESKPSDGESSEDKQNEKLQTITLPEGFQVKFNPDLFTTNCSSTSEEVEGERKKQEEDVRDLCEFLQKNLIPQIIPEFISTNVIDGVGLTKLFHKLGVNMRYLGKVAKLAEQLQAETPILLYLKNLCVQEMIVRAIKHINNRYLSEIPITKVQSMVSHLLNCIFGLDDGKHDNGFSIKSLQNQIRTTVSSRFRYELPEDIFKTSHKRSLLRSICLRLGIQIEAREFFSGYDHPVNGEKKKTAKKNKSKVSDKASRPHYFIADDIVALVPIVKHSGIKVPFLEETAEAARISFNKGDVNVGKELLTESLALHEQIYGVVHPNTAAIYYECAWLEFSAGEKEKAIDYMTKAVVISERVLGVDHFDTLQCYLNLSRFYSSTQQLNHALRYICHVTYHWNFVCNGEHHESVKHCANIGALLQAMEQHSQSIDFYEKYRQMIENYNGNDQVAVGLSYHYLAKATALTGDFKKALTLEKKAYHMFEEKLGAEDLRTKDSSAWLSHITTLAVKNARLAAATSVSSIEGNMKQVK